MITGTIAEQSPHNDAAHTAAEQVHAVAAGAVHHGPITDAMGDGGFWSAVWWIGVAIIAFRALTMGRGITGRLMWIVFGTVGWIVCFNIVFFFGTMLGILGEKVDNTEHGVTYAPEVPGVTDDGYHGFRIGIGSNNNPPA